MGWYFSPVNFYIGFDENHQPSHFLAEVSNTPWNTRHYYGFLLTGEKTLYQHDKGFHVSPFNPINHNIKAILLRIVICRYIALRATLHTPMQLQYEGG